MQTTGETREEIDISSFELRRELLYLEEELESLQASKIFSLTKKVFHTCLLTVAS